MVSYNPNDPLGTGGFMQTAPPVSQTAKKKQKGFLLDNLSTGTGIGGAAGGAALGATVGSVVPGVGTAIGGILGALIGGGLGSAGGEVAENAITGDDLSKNVLKEGLIGGATSLPIGAGFKLARAGLKAGTGFGKVAAGDLVQQAGLQTIPKRTLTRLNGTNVIDDVALDTLTASGARSNNRLATNADNFASSVMASQSGMTASQARKLGIKPVQTFGNIFNRTGLTKLDDMAEVGRNLTGNGQDSILDTLTRAAFEDTRGVKMNSLRKTAQTIMDDGTSLLSKSERGRVLENMKNADIAINGGANGSISGSGNALAALDQANSFRGVANDLKNGFNITPKDKQMARIYDGVATDIERSLYGAQGVSQNVPLLTKAGSDDILFKAQAAREAGNESQAKAYESIAQELRNAKSVKDIRSMKKDWVDIGRVDKATAEAQGARTLTGQQFTTNVANMMSPKSFAGAIVDANAPTLAGKLKGLVSNSGTKQISGQGLGALTIREALGRAVTATPDEENPLDGLQVDAAQLQNNQITDQSQQIEEPSVGGYTKSQIETAIAQAAAEGNSSALSDLKTLYALLPDPQQGQQLNASTAAMVAKQATTDKSVNTLLDQYQRAGGGQGAIGGNISNVLGNIGFNSNAAAYNDQTAATARQVSRALGEVGAGSDSDAQAYISMLPRLTDTPEQAQLKITRLKQLLAGARQNTLQYGLGATSNTLEQ